MKQWLQKIKLRHINMMIIIWKKTFAGNIEITRKGDMDVPGYEEVYMSYRVDEVPIKGRWF